MASACRKYLRPTMRMASPVLSRPLRPARPAIWRTVVRSSQRLSLPCQWSLHRQVKAKLTQKACPSCTHFHPAASRYDLRSFGILPDLWCQNQSTAPRCKCTAWAHATLTWVRILVSLQCGLFPSAAAFSSTLHVKLSIAPIRGDMYGLLT